MAAGGGLLRPMYLWALKGRRVWRGTLHAEATSETLACSPFVRGWWLDKLAERARQVHAGEVEDPRGKLADLMLRRSLFAPNVDRLIVAIRRTEWVAANLASASRGAPTAEEDEWLDALL